MKILSFSDLTGRGINFSRVHIGRLENAGRFPKHVNLGDKRIGWVEDEVEAWLKERVAARPAPKSVTNDVDPVASAEHRKLEHADNEGGLR